MKCGREIREKLSEKRRCGSFFFIKVYFVEFVVTANVYVVYPNK